MGKRVFYGDDARRRLLGGAQILYEAVKTTMSPKGGNVVVGKFYGSPSVTHDGVTVAQSIELPDEDDDTLGYKQGAELIKEAASKMNDTVGDGTTTITVLTYHILKEANRLITAGYNPMMLKKGLDAAAETVLEKLDTMSTEVKGKQLAEVTTISAGDKVIGELVADVMEKVGKDGVVTVEGGQTVHTESELTEGYSFDNGFVSPYMATDTSRMEAVYENPAIIVTDKLATSIQELIPLIEQLNEAGRRNLLLIAQNIDGDLLPNLVVNKMKGIFNTVAVKAPSYGTNQKKTLQDIATLVGATLISDDEGMQFKNCDLSVVGTAKKIIVDGKSTTIIGGGGIAEDVQSRIADLKELLKTELDEYEKAKLEKRIAALSGKVAVIKVGGATETEIEEKKYRVDDAVAAAKAAMAEGIVPGGGVTLVTLAKETGDTDGGKLLKNALEQPFRIITSNAGLNPDEWLAEVRRTGKGINVMNEPELTDMIKAGVIDPVMVTKEAIKNAVSIAGTAMTMGALVVDIPEKESNQLPEGL